MNDDNQNLNTNETQLDQSNADVVAEKIADDEANAPVVEETTNTEEVVNEAPLDEKPEETVEEEVTETVSEEEAVSGDDAVTTEAGEVITPANSAPDNAHWYVLHTYSGHENKVAAAIRQRIEAMHVSGKVFSILVPTRDTVTVKRGKKEELKEKLFPGYILIQMILDDESWLVVRTTPGVTAFVGIGNRPTALSEKDVIAIMKFSEMAAPKFKASFTPGEAVRIVDGPFADFLGSVESIDEAKGKVRVLVSIFGRETPVELDFLQVAKL